MARDQVAFIMFFSAVEKEIQSDNTNTLRTITYSESTPSHFCPSIKLKQQDFYNILRWHCYCRVYE